jgi:hypothetical protein
MGTEIVRPSSKSTDNVSSVTLTLAALGSAGVTTTEGIPFISQPLQIFSCDSLNIAEFLTIVAVVISQQHIWIKPELGTLVLSIYVHMTWLNAIVRVKVETVRPNS